MKKCEIARSCVLLSEPTSTTTGKRSTWHTRPSVSVSLYTRLSHDSHPSGGRGYSLISQDLLLVLPWRPGLKNLEEADLNDGRWIQGSFVLPSESGSHVTTAVSWYPAHDLHSLSPDIRLLYLSSGCTNGLAGEWAVGEIYGTANDAGTYRQGHLRWMDKGE